MIILWDLGDGPRGYAMDALAPHSLPFSGAPEGMLLIEYPHVLETMSLKPGPIVDRAGFASVLPSPLHASVLAPIGDELRFRPVDAGTIVAENPFASFLAPTQDPGSCANGGGCHLGSDERFCITPCPDPEPPRPPAAPDAARLPVLTPCPAGWSEEQAADALEPATCTPFAGGVPACLPGEALLPSRGGCARVGSACPSGPFPADVPAGPVIYAWAGATGPSDGSAGAPYPRLSDAIEATPGGGVVVIGGGRYEEVRIVVPRPMLLLGACPDLTTISATVAVVAPGTQIREVTIDGAVVVEPGASLSLGGSAVIGRWPIAISVAGRFEGRHFVIRGGLVHGLIGWQGADVTVEEAAIEAAGLFGLTAVGSQLLARDVAITSAQHAGLYALDGAVARVEASFIGGAGLIAATVQANSRLEISGSLLSGAARGVLASRLANLLLERSLIQDVSRGMLLTSSTTASLRDVVIRRVTSKNAECEDPGWLEQNPCSEGGVRFGGIETWLATEVAVDRLFVADSPCGGIEGSQTALELRDYTVRRLSGVCDGFGLALGILTGSSVLLERARFLESHVGVSCSGAGAVLRDVDMVFADGQAESIGLWMGDGCAWETERVHMRGGGTGVGLDIGSRGTLRDARIEGTKRVGVHAADCITDAERLVISDVRGAGVYVEGEADVRLEDVSILGTLPEERPRGLPCTQPHCQGFAVATEGKRPIRMERFEISRSLISGMGMYLTEGSASGADLFDGVFASNGKGVVIFGSGNVPFDAGRLTTRVLFEGNDGNAIDEVDPAR
ncbi:MAG: hypothetical protein HYV07_14285 [Deltaproteobacteria bacterium]|nr:hypothetical protein [Deltaproteobacteria bacterium]